MLFHLPGGAAATTVSELAGLVDVMPTVLDILKLEVPSQVQGRSLLSLMTTKMTTKMATKTNKEKGDDARSLYAETFLPRLHFNWSELRAVETTNYHFIDAPSPNSTICRRIPARLRTCTRKRRLCRKRCMPA